MRRAAVLVMAVALLLTMTSAFSSGAAAGTGSPSPRSTSTPASEPVAPLSGDPRSEGEGPGLVGSPIAILLGVVLLGIVTALGTFVLVRWRGQPPG